MEYLKTIYQGYDLGIFQPRFTGRFFFAICIFLLLVTLVVYSSYPLEISPRAIQRTSKLVSKRLRVMSTRGAPLSITADYNKASDRWRYMTTVQVPFTTTTDILPMAELKAIINATNNLYPVTINASYLMENSTLCSSVANLSVLIIVHTSPDHFRRREDIRATYANASYYSALGSSRVLFLLGRVLSVELQTELMREFATYGDTLQGDFIDAYHNLTHKGVMGYKWISERCRNAEFILKVDDDITVNMYQLFTRILPEFAGKKKQIVCNHILPDSMPILRERKSKWYVSERHFRGKWGYPRYCSGFIVIFTNDFIHLLYKSASLTPFFWVDDVYLYGLLPGHVPGVTYCNLFPKRAQHMLDGTRAIQCYRNVTETCDYFVTGAGAQGEMRTAWSYMEKEFYNSTRQMS